MLQQSLRAEHVMLEGFPSNDDADPFDEWCHASGIEKEDIK